MIKRIWLPIVVGFSAGAIVAGSVLLAVFVARANNSDATEVKTNFSKVDPNNKVTQLDEVGGMKLVEMASNTKTINDLSYPLQAQPVTSVEIIEGVPTEVVSLVDPKNVPLGYVSEIETPWKKIQNKIAKRLNNGPEVGLLKAIYFQDGVPNGVEDYGFYIGASNEIFINTASSLQELISFNVLENYVPDRANPLLGASTSRTFTRLNTSYELFSELIAEQIFQTIYHEYGHHMAYVYLNSDNRNDATAPVTLSRRINETKTSSIEWDAEFLNDFRNTLGYNNENVPLTRSINNSFIFEAKRGNEYIKYFNKRIYPLATLYSQKDLFDRANLQKYITKKVNGVNTTVEATLTETYSELTNASGGISVGYVPFLRAGSTASKSQPPVTPAHLAYYWSFEELYTRKMQQATMPLELGAVNQLGITDYGYGSDGIVRIGPQSFQSSFLYDTWHYADEIDSVEATAAPVSPFYQDYLYKKSIVNNKSVFDNSKALALYTSMTTKMGYQSNDDLSLIWFKNSSDFDPVKGNVTYPERTWNAKFGGYISEEQQKTLKYVGYFNDNQNFVSVPITVNSFKFNIKERLNSTEIKPLKLTSDKYFYQTNNYVDLQEGDWFDHDLFFAETENGQGAVKLNSFNVRTSTDVGDWNDRDAYAFARNSVTAYKTSGNGVALKKWLK